MVNIIMIMEASGLVAIFRGIILIPRLTLVTGGQITQFILGELMAWGLLFSHVDMILSLNPLYATRTLNFNHGIDSFRPLEVHGLKQHQYMHMIKVEEVH